MASNQPPVQNQKKKGESLLTETYYPPSSTNVFDRTALSLAETRPASKQKGTNAAASAVINASSATATSTKQLSVAQMRKLGMKDGYEWEETLDENEKNRLSSLDKSIEVLKKTQARGRAYGAVLDIDKTLKSVNATTTINLRGAATSGDLWEEGEGEGEGGEGAHISKSVTKPPKGKNTSITVGIDSNSTLWDMDTRIAYERSILMSEMHRPLPSSFPRPQPEPQRKGAQFASYDKEMFKKLPKQGSGGGGGGGGALEMNKSVGATTTTKTKK